MEKEEYIKPKIEDMFVAKGYDGDDDSERCASGGYAINNCEPGGFFQPLPE